MELNIRKLNKEREGSNISGNRIGGKKAAKTNKDKYGENFYAEVGRLGGLKKVPKGFAMNRDLAVVVGAIGGKKSKRPKADKVNIGGYDAKYEAL